MPTKNKKNKNNNKFLSGEELRITREGSSKVQRWHVSQELEGMPIAGREIDYFDTPGDGDMDVTPMDLLALIEQEMRDRAVLVNKILVGPPMTHWRVLLALEDANKKQPKMIKEKQDAAKQKRNNKNQK